MKIFYRKTALAVLTACLLQPSWAAPSIQPAYAAKQALMDEMRQNNVYEVRAVSAQKLADLANGFHDQLIETSPDGRFLVMQLNRRELQSLQSQGFKVRLAQSYLQRRYNELRVRLMQTNGGKSPSRAPSARAFSTTAQEPVETIAGYSCYPSLEGTRAASRNLVANYPTLAHLISIGPSWELQNTGTGHDLQVLKITNSATTGVNNVKPKLFVNAAIHAREYATAPLVLAFANWLLTNYGSNADATWIVDHHEIHLLLQTNPDGRELAEAGASWRKNTNTNYCAANPSQRGADLNRNFTFNWNATNGAGSSGNDCDETFRGASAGSEPETQAMQNYVRSLFPDSRGPNISDAAPLNTAGIHLDIHSYGKLVQWPWGTTSQAAPNGTQLKTLGRKFAFFNGHRPQQSNTQYATDGGTRDLSYGELGIAGFNFEIGSAFFEPCSNYTSSILPQNLNALIYAAKVVRTPYITPAGPDITVLSLGNAASTTGVTAGTTVALTGTVSDARFSTANGTEATQNIAAAEYYIDTPPWVAGAVAKPMTASDGKFSAKTEAVRANISTSGLSVGKHIVYVRGKDSANVWGSFAAIFLVVN